MTSLWNWRVGNILCSSTCNLVGEPYSKQTKTQMNTQLLKCNEGKEPSTNMKIIIPEGQGVLGYRGVLNDFSEEASHLELKEEEELGTKVERRT